jgi:hypothetical protein
VPFAASNFGSSVKRSPSTSTARPPAKRSIRTFGPRRSPRMPTTRPALAAAARVPSIRRAWSSKLPCEKFTRTRSTPAAMRSASAAGGSVAGPSVATILVRLAICAPLLPAR